MFYLTKSTKEFLSSLNCGSDGLIKLHKADKHLDFMDEKYRKRLYTGEIIKSPEYLNRTSTGSTGYTGYTSCTGYTGYTGSTKVTSGQEVTPGKFAENYTELADLDTVLVYIRGTFALIPEARKQFITNFYGQTIGLLKASVWFADVNSHKPVYPRLKPNTDDVLKSMAKLDPNFDKLDVLTIKTPSDPDTDQSTKPVTWNSMYVELLDQPCSNPDNALVDISVDRTPLKTPRTIVNTESKPCSTSIIFCIRINLLNKPEIREHVKLIFDLFA